MISTDVAMAIRMGLRLLPPAMTSPEAVVLLGAYTLQEANGIHRYQIVQGRPDLRGPARGLWQFERGGGCKGVVNHPASRYWMAQVCEVRRVPFNATAIWNQLQFDDVLAAAAARLLIFTDPKRLPPMGEARAAWNLYIRTWRPGKPKPLVWSDNYEHALHWTNNLDWFDQ